LRLGIHTFTGGSLERAARTAVELGANTFQIFSASPRMWQARPADPGQVRLLQSVRERHDLHPLAIHVNYLVNLASPDAGIRARSIACFRGEVERAAAIGAEYLVVHPGSYRGQSIEEGIAAFVLGLRDATRGLRPRNLAILLENTAGAGCHLGSRFEELHSCASAPAIWTSRSASAWIPAICSPPASTSPRRPAFAPRSARPKTGWASHTFT
jgi:deoxyribonuclease-4